jgi:hypothetical protein
MAPITRAVPYRGLGVVYNETNKRNIKCFFDKE